MDFRVFRIISLSSTLEAEPVFLVIGAKVSGRKRTIDILGIGRVSIVQGKSVYGSEQECPWFRERVSMVQSKNVHRSGENVYRTSGRMSVVQDKSVYRSGKEGQNPDKSYLACI